MADLATSLGPTTLRSAVMTASGTAGRRDELAAYGNLAELGAVVVKSLSAEPWPGNPAPRVASVGVAMVNSVGLQGPGVEAWLAEDLPALTARGATVVASIWGRRVADFARAAEMLRGAPIAAVEVNVSCPNLESRNEIFAHSTSATEEVLAACDLGVPRWAKLSPNCADVVAIAEAAVRGGASAVTLTNTLLAIAIDVEQRRPVLGAGRGGMSGAGLHPVALRAVFDVAEALPELAITGVGGVRSGEEAVAFLMAGASAVQVGTATFEDPRSAWRVQRELSAWMDRHGVSNVAEIRGVAHG